MLRTCICVGLLVAWVLPVLAADKDKDVDKDETKAVKESKDKLISAGKITGKLTQVEGSQKYMTVQVTQKIANLNQGAVNSIANIQRQLQQAALNKNPVERQRRTAELSVQLEQQKANLYTYKDHTLKFELQATDDMKVRTMLLPVDYDDKGKPKKLSAKELDQLKGSDKKLPGYQAEFDSLKADQVVDVYLVKSKTTTSKPKAAKEKDKDKDFVAADDNRLKVSLIVIVDEPKR